IIALKYAARRYPVAHENAEDLAADFIIGRSVKHGRLRSRDAFSNIKPQRACRTAGRHAFSKVIPFSVSDHTADCASGGRALKGHAERASGCPLLGGICCKTRPCICGGAAVIFSPMSYRMLPLRERWTSRRETQQVAKAVGGRAAWRAAAGSARWQ